MTFAELKNKMPEITGFLLTHPNLPDNRVTEVWIKFRRDGSYIYINLEQPIPAKIIPLELVGRGNSLNCCESKKDRELIEYCKKSEILQFLEESINFKNNNVETVHKIKELINTFSDPYIHT